MQLEKDFSKISYLDIDPIKYYQIITSLNDLMRADLQKKLSQESKLVGNLATFILPGSDGRKEKGSPLSHFEVIAILNSDFPVEEVEEIEKSFESVLGELGINNLEVKTLGSSLAYYKNNSHIVQPGRVADGQIIYGDNKSLALIKKQLGTEILQMPGKKIERIEGLVKDARKVTETGKNKIGGQESLHFDLNNNVIFFNPNTKQLSFKVGPLRLVQNTLLLQEIKHMRRENDSELLSKLETSILPRISQLSDEKKLTLKKESLSEISEIYAFFLKLYHKSEELFRETGNTTELIDEQLKIEITKRLIKLNELMREFKII